MEAPRVLDARLGGLPPDADASVVVEAIAAVFSDMHSSVRVKKYHRSLEENGYDTIGGLMTLSVEDLLVLGMPQGHAKLVWGCLFPNFWSSFWIKHLYIFDMVVKRSTCVSTAPWRVD